MRDLFFIEVRNRVQEIRAKEAIGEYAENPAGMSAEARTLLDMVDTLVRLAEIARKEGLLALEEETHRLDRARPVERFLFQSVLYVVDGYDPELLEHLGLAAYFSSPCTDYEALTCLIILCGVLNIQSGAYPGTLEETLVALLPSELQEARNKLAEEKKEQEKAKQEGDCGDVEPDMSPVYQLYEGEMQLGPADEGYYIAVIIDELMKRLNDQSVQRILREVESSDLVLLLMIVSGAARKAVFENLSKRLALMIAEEMRATGAVRMKDAVQAAKKFFGIFLRLGESGEIPYDDDLLIREIAIFFFDAQKEKDAQYAREEKEQEDRINSLLLEFQEHSHKVIRFPLP